MPIEAARWTEDDAYNSNYSSIASAGRSKLEFWFAIEAVWNNTDSSYLKYDRHLGEGSEFIVDLYRYTPSERAQKNLFPATVAVKTAKVSSYDTPENGLVGRNDLHRFVKELKILTHAPIVQNPHIIKFHGATWKIEPNAPPIPQIVVEYSSLGDLGHYLRNRDSRWFRSDDPDFLLRKTMLIHNISDGLDAVHYSGIIHGDLKLANIMIFPAEDDIGPVAKLADFGCSILSADLEEARIYHGTRRYFPPDIGESEVMSIEDLQKCDVFALGLAFWEIMADGRPYYLDDECLETEAQRLNWLPSRYNDAFDRFIRSLTVNSSVEDSSSCLEDSLNLGYGPIIVRLQTLVHAMLESDRSSRFNAATVLNTMGSIVNSTWMETDDLRMARMSTFPSLPYFPVSIWKLVKSPLWGLLYSSQISSFAALQNISQILEKDQKGLAHLLLGYLYAHGYGTPYDFIESIKCLRAAAELDAQSAQYIILRVLSAVAKSTEVDLTQDNHYLIDVRECVSKDILDMEYCLSQSPASNNFVGRLREVNKLENIFILKSGFNLVTKEGRFEIPCFCNSSELKRILAEKSIQPWDCIAFIGIKKDFPVPLVHFITRLGWLDLLKSILEQDPWILERLGLPTWFSGVIEQNSNIFLTAACYGHHEVISYLVEYGLDPCPHIVKQIGNYDLQHNINGLFIIHFFSDDKMEEMAKLFHSHGADPNLTSPNGLVKETLPGFPIPLAVTPLDSAIFVGNLKGVRILLEMGADPLLQVAISGFPTHSALELAVALHLHEIISLILQHLRKQKPEALLIQVKAMLWNISGGPLMGNDLFLKWFLHGEQWQEACAKTIQLCLDAGAELHHVGSHGQSPFAQACARHACQKYIVEALMAAGCNVNVDQTDSDGHTPLMLCNTDYWSDKDAAEVMKLLINHGADVNLTDTQQGATVVHFAAERKLTQCLLVLRDAGADLQLADKDGRTPLNLAVAYNSVEAARLIVNDFLQLQALGKTVYIPNPEKLINQAVSSSAVDTLSDPLGTIKELLRAGISIDERDCSVYWSTTAVASAVQVKSTPILVALLENGASPFCRYQPRLQLWSFLNEAIMHGRRVDEETASRFFNKVLHVAAPWIQKYKLLEVRDLGGRTILHYAMKYSQLYAIKALLRAGASLTDLLEKPYHHENEAKEDEWDYSGMNALEYAQILLSDVMSSSWISRPERAEPSHFRDPTWEETVKMIDFLTPQAFEAGLSVRRLSSMYKLVRAGLKRKPFQKYIPFTWGSG